MSPLSPEKNRGLRAVILAGGRGRACILFTINFPKPLMPVGDRPILEVLMERLAAHGITDITISVGHLAELIKAYFDQRPFWKEKITLSFVQEEKPLGTAGALSLVPDLNQTFIVMNGDLLTDLDFSALVKFHRESSASLTIAAHRREVKIDLGVLEVDGERRVRGYKEKPVSSLEVSMGIYVYEPRVLRWIPRGERLDLPDLVLKLIAAGEPVCAFPSQCQWLDIGRPDDYRQAQDLVLGVKEASVSTF
ncbi:MAG: NTP transferase domain-containing protein [Elusimicrobia bacterium]|nr:NTP transferase domain-containing protein [Elusimicrobiota bacterium]